VIYSHSLPIGKHFITTHEVCRAETMAPLVFLVQEQYTKRHSVSPELKPTIRVFLRLKLYVTIKIFHRRIIFRFKTAWKALQLPEHEKLTFQLSEILCACVCGHQNTECGYRCEYVRHLMPYIITFTLKGTMVPQSDDGCLRFSGFPRSDKCM
jgi:hypothetical protein